MARAGGKAPVNQRKHEQFGQNPCEVQFRSVSIKVANQLPFSVDINRKGRDWQMNNRKPMLFIKFGQKEHLESLQKGNLYLNNLDYFIQMEKKNNKKGMGDKSEASLMLTNVSIKFFHHDTHELAFTFDSAKTSLRMDEVLTKPVFCIMWVAAEDFEVIKEDENEVEAVLSFDAEQQKEMLSEFGDHALVIEAARFIEALERTLDQMELCCATGKIDYINYSTNKNAHLPELMNNDLSVYFKKDHSLSYQKEFRAVILNKDIEEPITINIGDMTSFSGILPSPHLLSGGFGVKINLKHESS
ncbi:hypothetical protein [Paenibacillus polymyxa]|uniref:hypothetical protein n=2 Tax=Paenibacillus polymyxa TaxID=1406 RepID=UPI002024EADA|nr:hypothetical protein [Paenibacillus polymyxa]URJ65679.3 hypothetical protein MF620_000490 [Paenibacillus polymyxa]